MTVNRSILNDTGNLIDPVKIALKKFESHPSIISIKDNVSVISKFSFSKVNKFDIESEIKSLKPNKASTFFNIPAKQLKQVVRVIVDPLKEIWNNEVIDNKQARSTLASCDA